MRRRVSIFVMMIGALLLVATVLRYRQENDDAAGHGVLSTPTTLDLYAGTNPEHGWSVGLSVVGGLLVVGGGIAWVRTRPSA